MTDPTPRVSVVMAAYNGARHLREAVESILGQSLTDLELIVVDDASTDATPQILSDYAAQDARMSVLTNDSNQGPFVSGNRGLAVARAPLIARMDADDISHPDRMLRQATFLEANPDHILVGNSYRAIDDTGATQYLKVKPTDAFGVRWTMRFRCPIEHPGAMFRASFPDGTPVRYDESHPIAQDFELFVRLTAAGKAAILPEVLFSYRTHPTNITSTRTAEQRRISYQIAQDVQAADLPPAFEGRLDGVLDCFLLGKPAKVETVQAGIRAFNEMLDYDLSQRPDRKRWLMRHSAAVLAEAFLRRGGGFRDGRVLAAFMGAGLRYLGPLLMRQLEETRWMPPALRSGADLPDAAVAGGQP